MAINYSLIITANPLSDSAASKIIFKAIQRLDVFSKDIDVFLPGFHTSKNVNGDSLEEVEENINAIKEGAKETDYHGNEPAFHTYCDSAGDMYFDDVDFCKFMMDMNADCPNLEYAGRTELIVLPTENGEILYGKPRSFNLEPFVMGFTKGYSLEEFLLSVFNTINKKKESSSLDLLDEIEHLYSDKIGNRYESGTTDITIRIDNIILKHMKWSQSCERIFISYSTKDEIDAYTLKYLLEKNGQDVWMAPEGIPIGVDYTCAIPAAIRITSRFVVLLSSHSATSVWVRREIEKAIKLGKTIDGVFVDGFGIKDVENNDTLDFLLSPYQLRYTLQDLTTDYTKLESFINNQ